MENAIQIFEHEQFGEVRVVMIDGEPWFVAADVGRILRLSNVRMSLQRLDDDEKGVNNIYTQGGYQDMAIVNEFGLYRLISTSTVDFAKRFQRWIFHEVLPSIRKTGSYSVTQTTNAGDSIALLAKAMLELAAVEREKIALEQDKIALEREKLAHDRDAFAVAQLFREMASAAKNYFLRDDLIRRSANALTGENFSNNNHDSSDID